MAEKSSELTYIDKIDTDSVETDFDNTSLQRSTAGDSLTDADATEDTPDDAKQIREQIEETRSQLSETIDAIQDKLSIANISEQVKDQVSEQIGSAVESAKGAFFDKATDVVNTVGRSFRQLGKSDLAKKTQENPWLVSVIGLGIGAVLAGMLTSGGKKKKSASYRYKKYEGDYKGRVADHSVRNLQSGGANRERTESSRDKRAEATHSTYENVSGAASTALEGVRGAAGSAYEGVGSAASKTYKSVGKASSFAYEKAGDLGEQAMKNYNHYIEENPLAVGAVAFAVGAAVGWAIPLTKVENQYLGEVRDNVVEKAQASAQEAIGTVKQMASEAQKVISEEVRSQTAS